MDLKARLSALKGQRGAQAGVEPAILGTTISERLRRLTVQATHTKRECTDQEVAARLQGQAFAPGLIRIEQRRLLAHVPGEPRQRRLRASPY